MNLGFAAMPWYFDILSFLGFGTLLAVVLTLVPAFAWSDSVISRTPNLRSDKLAEWFRFGLTVSTFVGSYVLAFAILAGWVA